MLLDSHEALFQVDWCDNGQKAIKEMRNPQHDVYLVDYFLGATNGLELIRTARGEGCRVPMILITGQGSRDVDMAAIASGASD